jgi:hypothetical protein
MGVPWEDGRLRGGVCNATLTSQLLNDNGSLQQYFVSLGNSIEGKRRHT